MNESHGAGYQALMQVKLRIRWVVLGAALVGCASDVSGESPTGVSTTQGLSASGKRLFETAFPGTNGRACATCHVLDEHTALSPAHVAERFAADREDPLFNRIDADDPTAPTPTYDHLKKGLVRVVLPLPENMDVIDEEGRVITPSDRKIAVWRGVPTVENTAVTGPYQLDGREAALPQQAQSAITSHSEGPIVLASDLERIAKFQRETFSSPRARLVAELFDRGVPVDDIPVPEKTMQLTAVERRGREVFDVACASCHGGATTTQITNRDARDGLFFDLRFDGNIRYEIVDGAPKPMLKPHPNSEFLNIGIGLLSGYGQLGVIPQFNADVSLPRYRFRFYADGRRQTQVVDLPPIPVDADGRRIDPPNLAIPLDHRGAPIVGPSLGLQWFSTDPGRAAITGSPLDFEAFDVPQLRGIAKTAPYFHDNSAATLKDAVDTYSRFILPFPQLNLPPIHPPESPNGPPESLSVQQKADLVAFLNRL